MPKRAKPIERINDSTITIKIKVGLAYELDQVVRSGYRGLSSRNEVVVYALREFINELERDGIIKLEYLENPK